MTYILIAVGAIIFYTIVMPLLDSLSVFAQSALNRIIHSWQMDMTYDEAQTQAATENINPPQSNTNAIGFEIPTEPDYSEEWCKNGKR